MPKNDELLIDKREQRRLRHARNLDSLFDAPFVLGSEKKGEFVALNKALKKEMPQNSVMDRYRVSLIANSMINARRTRRLEVDSIEGARTEALIRLLEPRIRDKVKRNETNRLVANYFGGTDKQRRRATKLLARLNITMGIIEALAMEIRMPSIMQFEKIRSRSEETIDKNEKKLAKSKAVKSSSDRRRRSSDRSHAQTVTRESNMPREKIEIDPWK